MTDDEIYAALAEMPTLHNSHWWPGTRDVSHMLMSNWPARYGELRRTGFIRRDLPFVSGAFKVPA
jgi:hypothetical protein